MNALEQLKAVVDKSNLEEKELIKKQLDLLYALPGENNEEVFAKLHELAQNDPRAVTVFIEQFVSTVVRMAT